MTLQATITTVSCRNLPHTLWIKANGNFASLCCKIVSARSFHTNYLNTCTQFATVTGHKQTGIVTPVCYCHKHSSNKPHVKMTSITVREIRNRWQEAFWVIHGHRGSNLWSLNVGSASVHRLLRLGTPANVGNCSCVLYQVKWCSSVEIAVLKCNRYAHCV